VYGFIQEHVEMTGSPVGQRMLENWEAEHKKFVKVFPHDYKRVLEERAAAKKQLAA
jgi:glutamate synthase domain-containing protein 3